LLQCNLSGAAGEAIGAALLTNKSLQKLEYGARSLRFAYFIFMHRLGAEQKLLTFYISPPFFFAAWDTTRRSPKQHGSRSQKVLLPANRCRSSCTVLVLTFCFLIFLHRLGAEQNTLLTYYISPSLLLCSLVGNDEITEAAWIKIAEGVAASKSLQKLKYGARSYVLLPYFSAPAPGRVKLAYFFTFSLPSFLQLEKLRLV
jgi:hypothetical protein